jgi:pimeloyl-ACP methyl ester carboxylesterase
MKPGANTALNVALTAPERLRGMVIEMPVLDNALLWSAVAFTPLLVALTFGEPAMKLLARGARAFPRRLLPHYGNVMLDTVRQEPGPSAALLQGLFFGRIAPHRNDRRTFQTPTLVLGHHRDPVHPFSDAGMLAAELPNARLLEASSILELRMQPERLTNEIAKFLDEVWETPRGKWTGKPATRASRAGKAPRPRKASRGASASSAGTASRSR